MTTIVHELSKKDGKSLSTLNVVAFFILFFSWLCRSKWNGGKKKKKITSSSILVALFDWTLSLVCLNLFPRCWFISKKKNQIREKKKHCDQFIHQFTMFILNINRHRVLLRWTIDLELFQEFKCSCQTALNCRYLTRRSFNARSCLHNWNYWPCFNVFCVNWTLSKFTIYKAFCFDLSETF